jgi:hypothetical protein
MMRHDGDPHTVRAAPVRFYSVFYDHGSEPTIAKKLVEHERFCYFRTMEIGRIGSASSVSEKESPLHGTEQ